jgi:predicted site-specific integrase-resolvase
MYVTLREAKKQLGLHPNTLRKYADEGIIETIKTPSGQRRFNIDSFINQKQSSLQTILYCRVSSARQKDDLQNQKIYLCSKYPGAEVIIDVGSGLNFKRKGLRAILERLLQGDSIKLVVAQRDRLCRFGFDLIEYLVTKNGGEILVLDQIEYSPEGELVSDILSIIHVFSYRIPGLRKYKNQIKEDKDLPRPNSKTIT